MSESAEFRVYGENGATFLMFQALANRPDAVQSVLLARLKKFGSGYTDSKWPALKDVEVWLFPNFGKATGFGEPDVVILGTDEQKKKHAFWIEVETTINCQRSLPSLRRSLVQLWRFRIFQAALQKRAVRRSKALRIEGETLSDELDIRPASVKLKNHAVLARIGEHLREAGRAEHDHYVLFTVDRPKGKGTGKDGYPVVLKQETERLSDGYPDAFPRLPLSRCWYAYWKADLKRVFKGLDLDELYVRIKKK